jgi:hypothetical protein
MEVVWESPPPPSTGKSNLGRKRSKHWDLIEALEARPGEWALIDPAAAKALSPMYAICRRHKLPFEFASRANADGTYSIYARRKETHAQEEPLQA